jgi:hypothetical protein
MNGEDVRFKSPQWEQKTSYLAVAAVGMDDLGDGIMRKERRRRGENEQTFFDV